MSEEEAREDRTRRRLRTSRMEAFSDGVFTIAGTLLVIELAVPPASTHLWDAVVEQWPSYLGYLAIAVYYLVPLGRARRRRRIHQAMAPHGDQGQK